MGKIAVLPPELASQIAAGEIAERPASVAKELIENALDASASRCDTEIDGGGITRLSVIDNGSGMAEDDLRLCLHRHATSKLRTLSDLSRVASYGFRGEALPSIASVSRVLLRSRLSDSNSGFELRTEAGREPTLHETGTPVGTEVVISDLFFNVPARRKFLRSSATEGGHVTEVVENASLARPDVTFSLKRDGRTVREFLKVTSRADRVDQVLGHTELLHCQAERGPLSVEAFLSRPDAARNGAAALRLLVNNRPVRDRALLATVAHAYGSVLERGRYPRGVVFLDLAPELVDVNVHPQKTEVRFADPRAVTDALYGILSRSLAIALSQPSPQPSRRVPQNAPPTRDEPQTPEAEPTARDAAEHPPAALLDSTPAEETTELSLGGFARRDPSSAPVTLPLRDSAPAPIAPGPNLTWSSLSFVVQLRQTYLLCEGSDGLYLLDQHAAAERVTFTKLRRAYLSRQVPAQALLFPALIEVSAEEAEVVERRSTELASVGLDVRVRGPTSVSVHSVPKLLVRASPERLLRDLLSEINRQGERAFSQAVDLALATMACHGSVRAGDPLNESEVTALLRALDGADFAGHCPHGRPVVFFLGWSELERRVGRR